MNGRQRISDSSLMRGRRDLSGAVAVPDPAQDPAARNYIFICLAAMVVLLVVLLYQGLGTGSLIPVLVGIMGVVTRWRIGPLLLIVALAGLYYIEMIRYYGIVRPPEFETPELSDVLLGGAVVVYAAAHYRLQGLLHEIVPRAPSRPGRRQGALHDPQPEPSACRSTRAVPESELAWLFCVPGWAAAAVVLWLALPAPVSYLATHVELRPQDWQAGLLVWSLGVGLLVLNSFVNYAGFRRLGAAEARLVLQDVAWRETRREQGRINRWLAWARLRRQRREEKP